MRPLRLPMMSARRDCRGPVSRRRCYSPASHSRNHEGGHVVSRSDCGNRQVQGTQRRRGRGLLRAPEPRRQGPRRGRDHAHAGLGRMDHRDHAQARPSRLRRDLPAPLLPRRHRQPGRPRRPGARGRRRGRRQVVGDAAGADGVSARAAQCQRQGRRDRLLLRRPPRLSWSAAGFRASTRWSIAGAATWSSTIPRRSTPSGRSRRSI